MSFCLDTSISRALQDSVTVAADCIHLLAHFTYEAQRLCERTHVQTFGSAQQLDAEDQAVMASAGGPVQQAGYEG